MKRQHILSIASALFAGVLTTPVHAAVISITTGASANNRQGFDFANDQFALDTAVFRIDAPLVFASSAGGNPGQSGTPADNAGTFPANANFIVLLNYDNNDANGAFPANWDNSFNARNALRSIAANTDGNRAGFFLYWNEALGVNRLAYTSNLNDGEAALQILFAQNSANLTSNAVDLRDGGAQVGLRAEANANFNNLGGFSASNISVVPEPSAALLSGIALIGALARRKR